MVVTMMMTTLLELRTKHYVNAFQKLLKKFNPNDGLLVGCCCCDRVGGSSGDDGRLEPGEFKGGVELADFVLAGGCTESLDIVFDEPSGIFITRGN